ncbi:MAG: hypothetical protein M1832_004783 [Thelocarpon impressellum]|nr:MAG: hypothetical protein M1832_004783 [Thelocarpon impressellum]
MWFVKLTVLLLYLRLFPDKWTRIGVFVMLFITASQFVANEVAIFASCKPLAKLWDLSITDGKCNDQNKQNLGSGYMNVFTDVLIFLLPLPRVYLLKLPQRQKAALMGVFALGAFVCAVSIVRLVEVYPLLKDPDPSWKVVSPLIWSILELDVGIICACLVVYRPFLRRYAPPFLAWSEKTMYTASTGPSKESASKNKQQRCRRNDSYILSSKSDGVSEPEPLELGDGPKAEVSIYAQGAIDRSRKPSVGAPPHSDDRDESTDYILKDGSEQHDPAHDNAIMKSTQVQVKRTDKN